MAYEVWESVGDFLGDMLAHHLLKEPHHVELQRVLVLLPKCVTATKGTVDPSVVNTLRDRRFDYAPVSGLSTVVGWGLISLPKLEDLHGRELELTEREVEPDEVALRVLPVEAMPLGQVLAIFMELAACLFVRPDEGAVCGFMTRSDLNHREIRRAAYELLAEVEEGLANIVRLDYGDPWNWIDKLSSEDDRARVVGYWELLKRRSIESDPLSLLTVIQLLGLAGKSTWIRERLGHKSRTSLEGSVPGIAEFRNRVMHPVRPLISRAEDIKKFTGTIVGLETILGRLRAP
jgi:hypothetical protein